MQSVFKALALTLYPEMFPGPLGHSLSGRALKEGVWSLETMNIRDFATDRHRSVDDTPYGGGAGMVMRPDIVDAAILAAKRKLSEATLIHFTPRGVPMTQAMVRQLVERPVILLCGRFEAIDQRVLDAHHPLEISLGDFVLSGGEIAALALLDAAVRLLPGVMGHDASGAEESFGSHPDYAGLLEYPHYTRPPSWNGHTVPEVLQSGNHERIRLWRLEQARATTQAKRPDVWNRYLHGATRQGDEE